MITKFIKEKNEAIENKIVIGLNADLVASSALSGQAIKRGMQLAIDEINQGGGLLGKHLKINARDNSGISSHGINNIKEFSTMPNLAVVMCGIYSPFGLAELDIIHKNKIIFLDPWAAATPIVDNGYEPNYLFRVSVRDEFAGPFLVDKASEKYSNIALLLVNDGWGKSNLKSITAALKVKNKIPIAVEWFNWGSKDMSPQLARIEKMNADVIIVVGGVKEGSTIIKNMANRNVKIPFISHWGITADNFSKAVSRELEEVKLEFLQTYTFMATTTPEQKKLTESYYKKYNVNSPGDIFAPVGTANAYDLVHLLALAIERAGSIDSPLVRDQMEQIKQHRGVVKHYNPPFTKSRHDALDQIFFFLAEFDRNGNIVPIIKH